jgi:hypothetical protein
MGRADASALPCHPHISETSGNWGTTAAELTTPTAVPSPPAVVVVGATRAVARASAGAPAGCAIARRAAKDYDAPMMRAFAAGLLFVGLNVVLAPTSPELHSRYGEPNLERFKARDGIDVSVEYGSDGAACTILIEPPIPLLHREAQAPLMLSDTVTEILEEVAPVASRGVPLGTQTESMGCAGGQTTDYLDMKIYRQRNDCTSPNPEHDVRATITYKRDICRAPQKK